MFTFAIGDEVQETPLLLARESVGQKTIVLPN
jgi:hypothetical protein